VAELIDPVDLLHRVYRRVHPFMHRRAGHVRRPELRADAPRVQPRDVGHQLGLVDQEIDRVDPAVVLDLARDVVVAVDQGHGLQDRERAGAVIRGSGHGWLGLCGEECQRITGSHQDRYGSDAEQGKASNE